MLTAALALPSFLWMLSFLAITPFLSSISPDLGVSVPVLGQLPAAVALASAPAGLVIGPIADRMGQRHFLVGGLIAQAAGAGVMALATSFPVLALGSAMGALGYVSVRPVSLALIAACFEGPRRQKVISLSTSAMAFAGIAGIPALLFVSSVLDWRGAFYALAGVNVLGAALVIVGVRLATLGAVRRFESPRSLFASIAKHRSTVGLIGTTLLGSAAIWVFYTYRGAFFIDEFGFDDRLVGVAFTSAGIGLFVGGLIAGSAKLAISMRALLIASLALTGLFLAFPLLVPVGPIVAVLSGALASGALGGLIVSNAALLMQEPTGSSATTMSVNQAGGSIGTAFGGAIGGLLLAAGGYPTLGIGILMITSVGVSVAVLLVLSKPSKLVPGSTND